MPTLDHVETWVFDLDNTLYPSSCNLFAQVDVRIGEYIADLLGLPYEEARRLQKDHFRKYGTTMRGLMTEHGIDPHAFMRFVHEIDHSPVQPNPALAATIEALPGRRYIFTNADVSHSEAVMNRLGVAHLFDDIFDIAAAGFVPKPHDPFYDTFLDRHGVDPARSVLFEDMAKNLKPAHERGMTTVLIHTDSDYAMEGHDGDHVHHRTDDLADWLAALVEARGL